MILVDRLVKYPIEDIRPILYLYVFLLLLSYYFPVVFA